MSIFTTMFNARDTLFIRHLVDCWILNLALQRGLRPLEDSGFPNCVLFIIHPLCTLAQVFLFFLCRPYRTPFFSALEPDFYLIFFLQNNLSKRVLPYIQPDYPILNFGYLTKSGNQVKGWVCTIVTQVVLSGKSGQNQVFHYNTFHHLRIIFVIELRARLRGVFVILPTRPKKARTRLALPSL